MVPWGDGIWCLGDVGYGALGRWDMVPGGGGIVR